MKKLLSLILALIMVMSIAACSNEAPETETEDPATSETSSEAEPNPEEPVEEPFAGADISIGVLKGPTGMGAAWLMDQMDQGLTANRYDLPLPAPQMNLPDALSRVTLILRLFPPTQFLRSITKPKAKSSALA